jgi:pSer/pThr/pTyr-binding forkhead associated (FHA) protein
MMDDVGAKTRRPGELAAQTPSSNACLLVVSQDGTVGRSYPLTVDQMDIGRESGDVLLPSDRFVSPRHARVVRTAGRVVIQDLSSLNGVYKRLSGPVKLETGDQFLIGVAVLKFELFDPTERQLSLASDNGTQVFGSPPSPRYARISEMTMEGISRSIFIVVREETILGREVGDIVFSSDPFMSRRHAAITRNTQDGTFNLVDLGSSNGTFVRVRGSAELAPGDHVRIGQHLFRYDQGNGQVPGQEQAQVR